VYDQAGVVAENVREIRDRVAARFAEPFEVMVVSDGSVDGTAERLLKSELQNVRVLYYDRNLGKGAVLGMLAITCLTIDDLVAAKATFSAHEAGLYGADSLIGRVVLYLPLAIVTVLLPQVAAGVSAGQETRHLLKTSLLATGFSASPSPSCTRRHRISSSGSRSARSTRGDSPRQLLAADIALALVPLAVEVVASVKIPAAQPVGRVGT